MDEPVKSETCKERRDAIGRSIDSINVETKKAYEERSDIRKELHDMRDGSEERVDAIMQKVSDKAATIHTDLLEKFKDVTGGVSMRLFLWVSATLVAGLCSSIGYLYAMNTGMGEYRNEINNTVNSLTTDTKLIQQEIEHSKEILKRVEDRIENGREWHE